MTEKQKEAAGKFRFFPSASRSHDLQLPPLKTNSKAEVVALVLFDIFA
jgi:hypothetical protein